MGLRVSCPISSAAKSGFKFTPECPMRFQRERARTARDGDFQIGNRKALVGGPCERTATTAARRRSRSRTKDGRATA